MEATFIFFFFFDCFAPLQNRILWIDEKNLTAHVEAGIVGQDLERLVSGAHSLARSLLSHLHAQTAVCSCDTAALGHLCTLGTLGT